VRRLSEKTARSIGQENLTKPDIAAAIAAGQTRVAEGRRASAARAYWSEIPSIRALQRPPRQGVHSSMPKREPPPQDLAGKICEAVKRLTARRQSRTYAAQWIMVHDIAQALGIDEAAVQTAARIAAERCHLAIEGEPVHSVSLIYGREP
jgi:phage terminase small subunit